MAYQSLYLSIFLSFQQFFHLISSASISATVFQFCIHNEDNQVYYCKQNQDAEIYFCLLFLFLAHLSQRLTGELIVYPWSGVRRCPSVVRPSFTMLKHLLLRNRLANQSQILCGASLGRGNEILFAASGSHDQDGRHAHIW